MATRRPTSLTAPRRLTDAVGSHLSSSLALPREHRVQRRILVDRADARVADIGHESDVSVWVVL